MEPIITGFNNTEIAFRHHSDHDLRKARLLFQTLSKPWIVKAGKVLMNFAIQTGIPVDWAVKPTIYSHFVGGFTLHDCEPVVNNLANYRVHSILDYSVEGKHDEESMQHTLDETLRSIKNAAGNPHIPFAVFKPTAFASHKLLDEASPDKPLNDSMKVEFEKFKNRIEILCSAASQSGVPLMIDAEDSWYQHLVDEVVESMMQKFNKEKAIVFNTLQMYRHDRIAFLKKSISKAKEGKYFLGVKFVRGAYMEKERFRAAEMGYPSPIHPDKAATDKAFDEALNISVNNLDVVEIFCGSHNENSNQLLANEMDRLNIPRDDRRIWFAQLFGMSDHISFNLANAGFNVAKYVPYGPVKSVMPYLIRRAEENTSIAGQTSRELLLIQTELKRRKLA